MAGLCLEILPTKFAVCRLQHDTSIPEWALTGHFFSISKTEEELSIVCEEGYVPGGTKCESGWRALKVKGPLDFGLTGILASIAQPLALAKVSLFAISTFDTDYVLIKHDCVDRAAEALTRAGHHVS